MTFVRIPYAVLAEMTDGFSNDQHLGQGSYANVFKGQTNRVSMSLDPEVKSLLATFPEQVAVKRDKRPQEALPEGASESAKKERAMLEKGDQQEAAICSKYKHRNLCNLLALCAEDGPHRCLVFEFCGGGNLYDRLQCDSSTKMLTAHQRLLIGAGGAQGLEYLHCAAQPPVLHRDVKSENILLTNEHLPKV